MPSPNSFVCKSAAPAGNAAQENYKLVIQSVNLIIHTKQFTSTAHDALMQHFLHHNIRLMPYIVRPNEAAVHPRELDVNQLRCFYRPPSRPCHSWSDERRRHRGRLPEEPFQFS